MPGPSAQAPMQPALHYIHDPLCGWCYAAEPLLDAALAAEPEIDLRLHGGGLFEAAVLPMAKRGYIRQADARIGELSGQRFGRPYLDDLLGDPALVYDSVPPIAAILAAQSLRPGAGVAMFKAVQHAHYEAGQRVVQAPVLADLAVSLGLDRARFEAAHTEIGHGPARRHIEATRRFMSDVGVGGFPGFVLQLGDRFAAVRHEPCYGRPAQFVAEVARVASALRTAA